MNKTTQANIARMGQNFVKMATKQKNSVGSFVVAESMQMNGAANSLNINLTVKNEGLTPLFLVIGTPMGIPDEMVLNPPLLSLIGPIANLPANAQNVRDQLGLGANYITQINKRLVRNSIYFNYIEVVTESDTQRSISPFRVEAPLNYLPNSNKKESEYNPVYTEYNGAIFFGDTGVHCGEYSGFALEILADTEVKINLKVGAIDSEALKGFSKR